MRRSSRPNQRDSLWGTLWLRAFVLWVSFFALALFSGQFVFPPNPSSVLWLPSGLSLAFLIRTSPRGWPALLAAIFLAEFAAVCISHGFSIHLGVPLLWSLGNVLRSLFGAWLMRHLVGSSIHLSRGWEVAGLLLFGGLLSPVPSATLGVLGAELRSGSTSLADWTGWWLSDGLGTLLVAPLLLTWPPKALQYKRLRYLLELGVTTAVTAVAAHFIFGQPAPSGVWSSLPYASFPFVLWGALRLGPAGAATTSAAVAAFALWHTLLGRGPFGTLAAIPLQKVLTLQAFLAIVGMTALMLAAVASERRRTERLQNLLVEAGTVLAASLEIRESFPRVARLAVPRACAGFAVWLVGENGLLERVAQAGWSADRESRVRGHMPPLPATPQCWRSAEGRVFLAPLRFRGNVQGVLVLMDDHWARSTGKADLALAEDLAHHFSMALERARLYEEARAAIEARNEFIAIAAHELRTPLTALSLRMRSLDVLLQRERCTVETQEKFRVMSRQLTRLCQLVERLLDVGRITTGRLELHREQVDVHELVEQVVDSFTEEARRLSTPMRVEAQAGLTAWCDRGRVEQALANLLANALKFGAGQPIDIQVSGEGPWVRITVKDHGIGIPPEALERIFERFERAVSSSKYGGLGLGLFLTRQIAESHGGTIHVESHPGEGATFVLQLPARQQPEARRAATSHPLPS
jgi:signal transduction histidine kinase